MGRLQHLRPGRPDHRAVAGRFVPTAGWSSEHGDVRDKLDRMPPEPVLPVFHRTRSTRAGFPAGTPRSLLIRG